MSVELTEIGVYNNYTEVTYTVSGPSQNMKWDEMWLHKNAS